MNADKPRHQDEASQSRPGIYSDPDVPRSSATLHVEDVMTRDVAVVNSQSTMEEAAELMRQRDVGPLPVCDHAQLVGLITDRDILLRSVARGEDPTCDRVAAVMTKELICCHPEDDAAAAARLMRVNHFQQLPVVDHDNHLVGIVSLGDVVRGENVS